MEREILLFIQDFIRNDFLNPIMIFITSLGDKGFIWITISLLLLCHKKTRKAGVFSLIALTASLFLNNIMIKNLVQRPRPFTQIAELQILIPRPGEFSFPSGHTSSSFASAGVFYRLLDNKKLGIVLLILAFLIGLSRMYIGVHYPTDVLAGGCLGFFISQMVCILLNPVWERGRQKR